MDAIKIINTCLFILESPCVRASISRNLYACHQGQGDSCMEGHSSVLYYSRYQDLSPLINVFWVSLSFPLFVPDFISKYTLNTLLSNSLSASLSVCLTLTHSLTLSLSLPLCPISVITPLTGWLQAHHFRNELVEMHNERNSIKLLQTGNM